MPRLTPRQFCQEQLLLLGDEELLPLAQAATLEILHSTVMKDPDGPTFEARLAVLAAASTEDGHRLEVRPTSPPAAEVAVGRTSSDRRCLGPESPDGFSAQALGAAAQVAQVLLEAWREALAEEASSGG